MSRGIGTRQQLILAAMRMIETDFRPGAELYVWEIINAAGELGLDDEATARKARKDAQQAGWEEARRQHRIDIEALAASSDADAQAELERLQHLDFMTSTLKGLLSRRWSQGSPPRMRDPVEAEHVVNPSRVLALLQQRGLVERTVRRGHGASARLTDAGRVVAQQVLEDLAKASPAPVETA